MIVTRFDLQQHIANLSALAQDYETPRDMRESIHVVCEAAKLVQFQHYPKNPTYGIHEIRVPQGTPYIQIDV